MWKEFITAVRPALEPNGPLVEEKVFLNLKEVIGVESRHSYVEVWNETNGEYDEILGVGLILFRNKTIGVIGCSYEEIMDLIKLVPKNSAFHRGAV